MYDPELVQPMRDEVARYGLRELRTPADVDVALRDSGTTLVFVNSACCWAAAGARPALGYALMGARRPERCVSVFAGVESDAVARAREYFRPFRASSPQIALLKDGQVVEMWQRHDFEGRDPRTIAASLTKAFEEHCAE